MWKIHRYYLKEVTTSAVLTFGVLFGIVLIAMVARGIDRAVGGTLYDAALITFYWTVDTFPHLLTISLLFATVLTFARASQDREITAIRSAGISPRVPMAAALLVGVVFSLGGSYLLHQWIPYAHFKKYRVFSEMVRNLALNLNLQGDQIPLGDGMTMSFTDREGQEFRDCRIYRHRPSERELGIPELPVITVRRVAFSVPEHQERILVLLKGVRDPMHPDELYAEDLRFAVDLRSITEQNRRDESVKDIASDQLLAEVRSGISEKPGAARYHVHRRACFALMAALFAPIGFCIGVMSRDRGRIVAMLFALVPLLLFYVCDVVAKRLMQTTELPWIAWLPAVVLTVLGVPFCWRLLRL